MILRHADWHPAPAPWGPLTEADCAPIAHARGGGVAMPSLGARACAGTRAKSHEEKSRCLSLTQEETAGVSS